MYLFLKISFPSARDLSFEETEVYHAAIGGSRINMGDRVKEPGISKSSFELSGAEVKKYEELAVKGIIVQAVVFQDWLSEAYGAHTRDHAVVVREIQKHDRAIMQAKLSDMYSTLELLNHMADISRYDVHEQEVFITKWKSFNFHSVAEELNVPAGVNFADMKQRAKSIFSELRDKTDIEELRNSFAKNYEKVEGKLEKRVDIMGKLRKFFANDRFENVQNSMDEQIASRAEQMMEHSVKFNDDEFADMLLRIYQVLRSAQLEQIAS